MTAEDTVWRIEAQSRRNRPAARLKSKASLEDMESSALAPNVLSVEPRQFA
jgi:hypothetical protein